MINIINSGNVIDSVLTGVVFAQQEIPYTELNFFNGAIVLSKDKAVLYGEEIKDMGVLYNEMLKLLRG